MLLPVHAAPAWTTKGSGPWAGCDTAYHKLNKLHADCSRLPQTGAGLQPGAGEPTHHDALSPLVRAQKAVVGTYLRMAHCASDPPPHVCGSVHVCMHTPFPVVSLRCVLFLLCLSML